MSPPTRGASAFVVAVCLLACSGGRRAAVRAPAADATDTENQQAPHAAAVGDRPPPIAVRAIDGTPLTLATGKVTLLVFWATWSEPDKKELIQVERMVARFGTEKLAVIALSIDDEADRIAEFAQTYGLRFPIAWDAGHRFAATYRVASDPSTYVIDRSGIIRFVHSGYHDEEAAEIAAEIESLTR